MTFNYDNLPEELKKYKIFTLFKEKIPLQLNGYNAKSNDPQTWATFSEAYNVLQKNSEFKGIGVMLGYVKEYNKYLSGIDLDHVIENGEITQNIQNLINAMNSYTEISQSGLGLHILFFTDKLHFTIKKKIGEDKNFELYFSDRFFALTNNIFQGHKTLRTIEENELKEIINIFLSQYIEPEENNENIKNSSENNLNNKLINQGLTLEKVFEYYSEQYPELKNWKEIGKKFYTKNPLHESHTGQNFAYNPNTNQWYCFRHDIGGSVIEAIALLEKILKCEDFPTIEYIQNRNEIKKYREPLWKNHTEEFKKVLKVIKDKFGIDLFTIKKDLDKKEKNQDEEEDEDKKISYYVKFEYEGKYYNEIKTESGYQFIVFDKNGNIEGIVPEVPIIKDDDEIIRVLPAPQIPERKIDLLLNDNKNNELVKFPNYPVEFGTPYDLFKEIKQFIHKYVELKPLDETLLAIYGMQASLFDLEKKFTFPFVHLIGAYGRGKTRTLTILYYLIPYSIFTDDIKSAPIKRVSQLYNPVLLVDEKGQMDQDLRAVLNARYNKNAVILNANKEIQTGFSGIIAYRIPGPMVLAGREVFHDPAIESKSFQINMNFELTREDIPRELKGKVFEEFIKESEILRSKLMMFRIKYFSKINESINTEPAWLKEYELITEPRLYELLSSLSDILNVIPELENEITEIIDEQIKQNVLVAQETPEGMVAKTLIEILKDDMNGKEYDKEEYEIEPIKEYTFNGKEYTGIYLKAIYNQIGENYANRVGMLLSQLGLNTDCKRQLNFPHCRQSKIPHIWQFKIPHLLTQIGGVEICYPRRIGL